MTKIRTDDCPFLHNYLFWQEHQALCSAALGGKNDPSHQKSAAAICRASDACKCVAIQCNAMPLTEGSLGLFAPLLLSFVSFLLCCSPIQFQIPDLRFCFSFYLVFLTSFYVYHRSAESMAERIS